MDFVPMSEFTREAEVSVVGLKPELGPRADRDVYLFVETRNMPPPRPRTEIKAVSLRQVGGATRTRSVSVPGARVEILLTPEQIDSVMPTYRIYAWHTSGDSITVHGQRWPILRAQTTFGYWLDHDGVLQGWQHELEGATLVRLSDNWYRIAVPKNGITTVTTRIEALEPRRSALSLHAGPSFPYGSFKNSYDQGMGATFNLERRLSGTFSLTALFGYHRFDSLGTSVSAPSRPRLELFHISGSLEATLLAAGPLAFVIDAGGGAYRFRPGATKPGAHAGVGIEIAPSLSLALGFWARGHNVFTGGTNTTFAAIQAGGRVMF
jgi:hypothetical protein